MIENSLLIGVIDGFKKIVKAENDTCFKSLFCYFCAGALDGLFFTPFELVKIRYFLSKKKIYILN